MDREREPPRHVRGVAWPRRVDGLLRVHHFPFRSAAQFVTKIRFRARKNPSRNSDEVRAWVRILEEEGEGALVARFDEVHRFADPDRGHAGARPLPLTLRGSRDQRRRASTLRPVAEAILPT